MVDRNKHMASGKGRWTVRKKIEGETQKREIAQERRKVVKKKNERPREEKKMRVGGHGTLKGRTFIMQ